MTFSSSSTTTIFGMRVMDILALLVGLVIGLVGVLAIEHFHHPQPQHHQAAAQLVASVKGCDVYQLPAKDNSRLYISVGRVCSVSAVMVEPPTIVMQQATPIAPQAKPLVHHHRHHYKHHHRRHHHRHHAPRVTGCDPVAINTLTFIPTPTLVT